MTALIKMSIDEVENVIERVLSITLEKHESSYVGLYSLYDGPLGTIKLSENENGYWREGDEEEHRYKFPENLDHKTILDLTGFEDQIKLIVSSLTPNIIII